MTRPKQTITVIPVERLSAHPGNIRDDLGDLTDMATSIREHGILQPLTATEHPTVEGQLILLAGHRRLSAALSIGETKVPVIIRHGLDDEAEQLVVMLVENTHRRDLHPVERAEAYGALRNRGLTLTEIARRTGTGPSVVSYYLNLLDLDDESLESVRDGTLNSTDAIEAVREARQLQRIRNGQKARGRKRSSKNGRNTTGAWFNPAHRLAPVVKARCTHRDARQVGGIGCGPCWETAIRTEEDNIATPPPASSEPNSPGRFAITGTSKHYDLDEVVVERVLSGDRSLSMTRAERLEAVRRLHARGLNDSEIADVISRTNHQVYRDRGDLGLPANVDAGGNPIGGAA